MLGTTRQARAGDRGAGWSSAYLGSFLSDRSDGRGRRSAGAALGQGRDPVRGSGRPRLSAHDAAGVGADPLDHRGKSVRALRRQVLGQLETPEHHLRIDPNDLVRAPARVDRKEDGDQPAHDMGVAVALEAEAQRGPGGGAIDLSREPDLTGAAANFVRLRSRSSRQWRQGAAELDHVAVAVLPVIQELEVREDVLERHGSCSSSATEDTMSAAPASAPVPMSLSPGLGEKYFSYLPGTLSHSLESAGVHSFMAST